MIDQLHFLRPEWLLAFIPLSALLAWLWQNKRIKGAWQAVCDPHLIPYVLEGRTQARRISNVVALGVAGALAILALAGPAWQQLPQPVFKQQEALVVMLDLSKSMDAPDVTPSRLVRARLKLLDLLRLRKEGQTALIVYAGDAFVVTPLTDDTDTIAALAQSLSTTIMPSQGSRPDRAIQQALELLTQAGVRTGSLLLITDGIDVDNGDTLAKAVVDAGHRLSIMGVGTSKGAPIPDGRGGFVKDSAGQIVIPSLDQARLQNVAGRAGGMYTSMQIDDSDIKQVLSQGTANALLSDSEQTELQTDRWREEGPWLLLLLLPIATLAFRRGLLVAVLCLGMHWSDPVLALSWGDLLLNSNQKGAHAMDREDYRGAAQQFTDNQWKAAALYRAGDYENALDRLQGIDTPDAAYNRGNALARLGRIQDAIESYQQTLQQQPGHEDAEHNLELLKSLQNQQNQQDQRQSPQADQQQNQQDQQQSSQADPQQNQGGDNQQQPQPNQPQRSDADRNQSENENENQPQSSRNQSNQGPTSEPERQPNQQSHTAKTQQQQQPQQQDPQQEKPDEPGSQHPAQAELNQQPQTEEQQATEQWLRRIPDDPGGLLRRKFRYQYSQRYQGAEREAQQW